MTAIDDPSVFLDDASETEWAFLHDQFDLADGFWLGFMFAPTFTASRVMAARAAGKLRAAGRSLRLWRLTDPRTLPGILNELVAAARAGTHDCLWVESLANEGAVEGWSEFLMRANEQREVFARHHRGGLMFVAPTAVKVLAQERSPDLWAFRSIVVELVVPRPVAPIEQVPKEPTVADRDATEASTATLDAAQAVLASATRFTAAFRATMKAAETLGEAGRISDARTLLLRLMMLARDEQTPRVWIAMTWALLANFELAQGDAPAAIDHLRLALRDAEVIDAAIARRWCHRLAALLSAQFDLVEATAVMNRGVVFARRATGEVDSPDGQRNLSVSLDRLATLRQEQGDLVGAEAAFSESLALCRRLLTVRGDAPEALRDLSISLDQMGTLRLAQGDLTGAEAAFSESLTLRRRLLADRRDVPEALRDLSVSLDRLGILRQEQGDLTGAEAAFSESLALRRRLLADRRDVPEALRDLSVSLDRLGTLRHGQGDLTGAEAAFSESLALCRRLLTVPGDVPEALRDLSVSLDRLGNLWQEQGDLVGAEAAFSESLALCRRLLTVRGDAPEALRDLSISLDQMGTLRQEQGDLVRAEAAFSESLTLRRRVLAVRGELPDALRGLVLALEKCGRVAQALGRPSDAEPARTEARTLVERLRALAHEGVHVGALPEIPPPPKRRAPRSRR